MTSLSIARDLAEAILGQRPQQLILEYAADLSATGISELLELVFGWNLDVYLYLWDVEWAEDEIQSQFRELIDACHRRGDEFAYWCLGMAGGTGAAIRRRGDRRSDPAAA